MQGQSQNQVGQKNTLTKTLAIAGTGLVWLPILAPVALSIATLVSRGVFRFDFLIPGELFPMVFAGGGLLVWAALRARSQRKLIVWSFGIAVGTLAFSQILAVVTGLASGDNPSEVVLGIVIAIFALYILTAVVTGVGGGLLIRDLFKQGKK